MTAASGSSSGQHAERQPAEFLALGVDGGGTKTEAWLATFDAAGEPRVIGRGKAGSSNVRAVGFAEAMVNLDAAVELAWQESHETRRPVNCAVLALSGAGHATVRDQVQQWAQAKGLAVQVRMEHDAEPVLAGGTPAGWGVGLIVGTGSVAIAADRHGGRRVVGGWGYWFGDEGSAYWLGRQALACVARASDGRGAQTALTLAIGERLQADDPRAMLTCIEQTGDARSAIAELAETVLAVAARGDEAASEIVDLAAEELATMTAAAAAGIGLDARFPLALAGGVICSSNLLRERLALAIVRRGLTPDPVSIVPHPVVGCLRLARRLPRS